MDNNTSTEDASASGGGVSINEQIRDGAIALTGLAGVALPWGGLLATGLSTFFTRKRFERLEVALAAVATRLAEVAPDTEELKERIQSDEFIHLCINALGEMCKEHRDEKRELFASLLVNWARTSDHDFDIGNHFISLLAEMDTVHLAVLKQLAKRNVGEWLSYGTLRNSESRLLAVPDEILLSGLQKLAAYGVLNTKGEKKIMFGTNPMGLWKTTKYAITPSGQRFWHFINH